MTNAASSNSSSKPQTPSGVGEGRLNCPSTTRPAVFSRSERCQAPSSGVPRSASAASRPPWPERLPEGVVGPPWPERLPEGVVGPPWPERPPEGVIGVGNELRAKVDRLGSCEEVE